MPEEKPQSPQGRTVFATGFTLHGVVLSDQVIKPLRAATCQLQPGLNPHSPNRLDLHYDALRTDMPGLFNALRIAAWIVSTILFSCSEVSSYKEVVAPIPL